MAEQSWQPVEGTPRHPFFKFGAIGDKISGKIVGKRQVPGLEGKIQDVVDLETKDGAFTVGLTADLKEKVGKIPQGDLVLIEFVDKKKIPGKPSPMKVFTVRTAKGGA